MNTTISPAIISLSIITIAPVDRSDPSAIPREFPSVAEGLNATDDWEGQAIEAEGLRSDFTRAQMSVLFLDNHVGNCSFKTRINLVPFNVMA